MTERKTGVKSFLIGVLIVTAGILLLKSCPRSVPNDLIGEWQFASMPRDRIIFSADATFQVKIDGGVYNQGEYRFDTSVSPARISIIPKKVYWFGGYPALPLTKGIVRFTDKSVAELAFKIEPSSRQIGGDFPPSFDHPSVKMVLQKLK